MVEWGPSRYLVFGAMESTYHNRLYGYGVLKYVDLSPVSQPCRFLSQHLNPQCLTSNQDFCLPWPFPRLSYLVDNDIQPRRATLETAATQPRHQTKAGYLTCGEHLRLIGSVMCP
jgi:hypothetical protein